MATPFIGEVKLISFNFAPKGWSLCQGQLLQINQNQALFSLLGTNYGGNGISTFGLPDLRGRAAMHQGAGWSIGQHGGEVNHTLSLGEMPAHTHNLQASTQDGNTQAPAGNVFARTVNNIYQDPKDLTTTNAAVVGQTGGSQPHNNMQPYLTLNYIIALVGVYPSQN